MSLRSQLQTEKFVKDRTFVLPVIDVTRCSVALADPADLMEAFQLLTSQESQDKLNYKIVRFKNKFEPKSTDTFKNIMVNALVRRVALVRIA